MSRSHSYKVPASARHHSERSCAVHTNRRPADFGATHLLDPSTIDSVPEAVRDLTGVRSVTKSLETSGASSAAGDAMHEGARFVIYRRIDVDALFTDTWNWGQAEEAYSLAAAQTSGKGVFVP
jgi:hypothetical protein